MADIRNHISWLHSYYNINLFIYSQNQLFFIMPQCKYATPTSITEVLHLITYVQLLSMTWLRLCLLTIPTTAIVPGVCWLMAGFLNFLSGKSVCMSACIHMHVSLPPRLLITTSMIWHSMDTTWMVKQLLFTNFMRKGILHTHV